MSDLILELLNNIKRTIFFHKIILNEYLIELETIEKYYILRLSTSPINNTNNENFINNVFNENYFIKR